jgi:hypothetical protein
VNEHEPLDDLDAATLGELREMYDAVDPAPADLVERVKFSLALDEMFEEVARMTRVPLEELAVRGDATPGTRTETLTFSAERLTAMVTVSHTGAGRLRIDGWLAPSESCRVRLRIQGASSRETVSDADGRFSFEDLDEGFGQLSFHPLADDGGEGQGDSDGDNAVVTPLFQL